MSAHAQFPSPCRECQLELLRRVVRCEGVDLIPHYCEHRAVMFTPLVRAGAILRWQVEGPIDRERFEEACRQLEAERHMPLPRRVTH